jgi:hypothetical protein
MGRRKSLLQIGVLLACYLITEQVHALDGSRYVTTKSVAGSICLVQNRSALPLVVSSHDWPGVVRAVGDLSDDVKRVTDQQPLVLSNRTQLHDTDAVLIGTIGKSEVVDDLIRRHKLDVSGIAGKWESAITAVVDRPLPGVRRALVIAGSALHPSYLGPPESFQGSAVMP